MPKVLKFEKLNSEHQIFFEPSPNEADLAITSINNEGNLGQLNEFVLLQYGYSKKDLPKKEELKAGFGAIPNIKGKPILFVVTIDGKRKTEIALEENLYNTLTEFRGWFRDKRVWLPLMGTGSGGLTLEDSYYATVKAINKFQNQYPTEVFFIISFPATESARILYKSLTEDIPNSEKSAEIFLKSLNCNFYLAGAFWSGEDQVKRFFENGLWEKGQEDDSYSEIINNIKENDVIIIKSVYAQNSEGYLRVKGIGIVTAASEDGASVLVDWRIRGLNIDIEGLSKYRNTISKANLSDIVTIFALLTPNEWEKLSGQGPATVNSNKIASLLSDTERGADYLDISKDITAFARVIAAKSFEPPLAIALFGKWGSGKSFFMRKLKEQIIDFSLRNKDNMYCEGVVQIHFNAWSYMDANLWASFVSKIFEGLYEYITQNSLSAQAKEEIEAELNSTLNIAKEELTILAGKKDAIQKQMDNLEAKRREIKQEVESKIKKIENQTVWTVVAKATEEFNAKEKIAESLNQNKTFIQTEEELKKIIPEKYWDNPEEAYQQIISKQTLLKEFFRRDKIKVNLLWLGLIILLIFITPLILELISAKASQINFLIPQAGLSLFLVLGAAWRRLEIVYKKLQPLMSSFWNIKEDYEKKKKEALAKFEQQEKVLKFEIEKGNEELLSLTEQIQKAENLKTDLEFKINNAIATETLYSFIEKRSKSDDYKRHLGIISIIRRDFEILNGLFIGHHQEIVNSERAEAFRKKFKKPLQRIVLYIDDLDRCPEENVVQVLEAVNLLMAFPLFIVIVGVDPRWVKNALIRKYTLQFTGKLNGSHKTETGIELIEPSNYLEKIFQVPFHLKSAPLKNVKEMIKQLATSKPTMSDAFKNNIDDNIYDTSSYANQAQELSNAETRTNVINTISTTDKPMVTEEESIELLEFSERETELMQDMGEVIGANPRAIKRFVNIYRIIKAHEEYTVSPNAPEEDLLAVLFLLAISTGQFKKLVPSFESYINDDNYSDKPIAFYFQLAQTNIDLQNTKHQLNVILSDISSYQTIQQTRASIFNHHNIFIKRFTFKNI